MKERSLILGFIVVIEAILLMISIFIILYLIKKEKRTVEHIQKMLDDAIEGKFQDVHLDESRLSAVENSMWHYLCNNQVSYRNLCREKEQIQTQISNISHQTIIPISNIILYSQLLEEWQTMQNRNDNSEAIEWTKAIREQAQELDFLIESLVKLSRLETGIIKVKTKKQNIQPVLSAVQKQFISKAKQKQIEFIVEHTEESAVFDLKWTIEAVANVVDNAIKYTPEGGKVSIYVEAYSFFVRINIIDNGIGIPETEQANIFTRFYRSSIVSEQLGLGIGLYLAREVMKVQNGYIKLVSKVGKGSMFSFFLLKEECPKSERL